MCGSNATKREFTLNKAGGVQLNSEPTYVQFFKLRNRLDKFADPSAIEKDIYSDYRITDIIDELQDWPCYELTTHKKVDHPLHKLSFIAELGFNRNDKGIQPIIDRILANQSEEGPFQVLINIPVRFGGTGKPLMSWVLSDAPVLLYALIKLNSGERSDRIQKAVQYIAGIVSDNGWHCLAAKELGKFRGPGRKDDPCPYATMFSLKMLSLTDEDEFKREKLIGINTIFNCWKRRKETKPYLFGMGTDFKKLKLPFVWYDILNIVDTLSCFKSIHDDPVFQELLNIILEKKAEGGYIPESIYLKAKPWDFGQKKIPSEYMNAIIQRIESRVFN